MVYVYFVTFLLLATNTALYFTEGLNDWICPITSNLILHESPSNCMTNGTDFITWLGGLSRVMIHSANPKSRPVGITVFAHVVRPSVRPHFSNLEKQNNRKQCSLLAWLRVWLSGSLMTTLLFYHYGSSFNFLNFACANFQLSVFL